MCIFSACSLLSLLGNCEFLRVAQVTFGLWLKANELHSSHYIYHRGDVKEDDARDLEKGARRVKQMPLAKYFTKYTHLLFGRSVNDILTVTHILPCNYRAIP